MQQYQQNSIHSRQHHSNSVSRALPASHGTHARHNSHSMIPATPLRSNCHQPHVVGPSNPTPATATAPATAAAAPQHPPTLPTSAQQPTSASWRYNPYMLLQRRLAHNSAILPTSSAILPQQQQLPAEMHILELEVGHPSVQLADGRYGSKAQRLTLELTILELLQVHVVAAARTGDDSSTNSDSGAENLKFLSYARRCGEAKRGTRGSFIELGIAQNSTAISKAVQLIGQGHWQLGQYKVPIRPGDSSQPLDTVEVLFLQPPFTWGKVGFSATILEAAGYSDVQVRAEWIGRKKSAGQLDLQLQYDTIIAWVVPPADDPQLLRLPDCFRDSRTGEHCKIRVRSRTADGWQKWLQQQVVLAVAAQPQPLQQTSQLQQQPQQHQRARATTATALCCGCCCKHICNNPCRHGSSNTCSSRACSNSTCSNSTCSNSQDCIAAQFCR